MKKIRHLLFLFLLMAGGTLGLQAQQGLVIEMSAASETVCDGTAFDPVTLQARYQSDAPGVYLNNSEVKYYLSYVSGDHVISNAGGYITSPWTPTAAGFGTGVYQITPFHNNNQGTPATITLTVLPELIASHLVNAQGTLTFENGNTVPEINIGANLPAGVRINWAADANAATIGMATSGANVVPTFNAVNTTDAPISVVVTYTLAYINTACTFANASGSFTITVLPRTNTSEDLTVTPDLTAQVGCDPFTPITFTADYQGTDVSASATFVVEFVSGNNIITNAGVVSNPWTPAITVGTSGIGLYKITPYYNNMKGVSYTIELGMLPEIDITNVNYADQALVYMNGERVDELVFRGLPEGVVYSWTAPGAGTIGSSTSGVASVPSFIAKNTTGAPISITYEFTAASDDYCHPNGNPESSFTITVYPTPALSGLEDMVYCNNASFNNITLPISLTDYYELAFVSGTDFGLELQGATTVICSTLVNTTSRTLSGTYSVTSYNNVTGTPGAVSYFTVKVHPDLFVAEPEDIVTVNGSTVPAYNFVGSTEAFFVWQRIGGDNESLLPEWGKGYQFPSFVAVNNTGGSATYTYNVWAVMENEAAFTSPSDIDDMCTSDMVSFTITIQPSPNIAGLESNEYCNEQEIKIALPALQEPTKKYQLDFYSGTNLGLAIETGATGDTITTADGFVHNPYNRTLVGTYALTVYDETDPTDKVTTYFTVTVYPTPNIDALKEIVTVNGAVVPDYLFTGNVQDGTYKWTLTEAPAGVTHNLPQYGDGNRFPSFTAQNYTNNVLTYKYAVLAFSQKSGDCDEVSDTLKITIYPTPAVAGLENLNYCNGSDILINLPATPTYDRYELAFVSGTDLSLISSADGMAVSGIAANNTNQTLSGIYSVTAYNTTTNMPGETAYFTVNIYPSAELNEIKSLVTVNGAYVPSFEFTSNLANGTYKWELTGRTPNGLEHTMPVIGEGNTFPAFVAENFDTEPVVYEYRVMVSSGEGCDSEVKEFTITIHPTPAIAGLENLVYCDGDDIEIVLPAPAAGDYYGFEFVSGTDLSLALQTDGVTIIGTAANTTSAAISGVYSVTSYNSANQTAGKTVYFTVTVNPAPVVDAPKSLVTVNGAYVPSFEFTSNLANGTYKWELTGRTPNGLEHTMPVIGEGNTFPAFVAENFDTEPVVYEYRVMVSSGEGCDSEVVEFTITIHPTPAIAGLENLVYCDGDDIEIVLPAPAAGDYYGFEFVSGTDLSLALQTDGVTIIGTAANTTSAAISGVYSVTSYNSANQTAGKTVYFTVTVNPAPVVDAPKSLVTVNGAYVPSFEFTSNLTNGTYKWELTGRTPNGLEHTMPEKGTGNVFPAFVAENFDTEPVVYEYRVMVSSGEGCDSEVVEFTITIHPTPAIAGLENLVYCDGDDIEIVLPAPAAGDYYGFEFVSGTDLSLALQTDGVTIIGTAANTTSVAISGVYSVTSYNSANQTAGKTVYFTVTVNPYPVVDTPKSLVTVNGAYVPSFEFTSNLASGTYKWELTGRTPNGLEHTMPVIGEGNTFPAFVAENFGTEPVVYEYRVMVSSGEGCDSEVVEFTITIHPTPAIAGLENLNYCNEADIEITLPVPAATDYYKLAFVSGKDLNLTLENDGVTITGTASNLTKQTISGVYSVTSCNKITNMPGEVVYFTVNIYPELNADDIIIADLTYNNGDRVPAIYFASSTKDVTYFWEHSGIVDEYIGSSSTGMDYIPEFIAVNRTDQPIVATYEVKMVIGDCISKEAKTFTITVNPNIIDTYNLYTTVSKAAQTICFDDVFESIELTLNHRTQNISGEDVIFEWTLQGNDVLGQGASGRFESTGSNIYEWDLSIANMATEAGTGIYTVTPIWNNYIGASISFSLTRKGYTTIHDIESLILCNNSALSVDFNGTAQGEYKWEVKGGSQLGIPNEGVNTGLYVSKLVNNTDAVITDTIIVTPLNVNDCNGEGVEFTVTVLPKVKVDQVETLLEAFGNNVAEIVFTGVATEYRWTSSNPLIATNPTIITNGTGNFPAFTATITETTPVVNMVTVTPVYSYKDVECVGETMQFAIIVAPKPVIENVDDIEVCEGEKVPVINFSLLNANSNYKITYEFSEHIGLDDDGTGRAIPSYEARYSGDGFEKQEATVTVTPRFELGDIQYPGQAITFTVTVYPKLVLEDVATVTTHICDGGIFELEAIVARGYQPAIQWYKDGAPIPGTDAQNSIYYAATSGSYFAVVTGRCGEITSSTHVIDVSYDIITQRWNDVLTVNLDTETNGGNTFTDIQWYKVGSPDVLSTLTYIGNVAEGETYYIKANGGTFVSCEYTVVKREPITFSLYPNPVKAGEYVTIEGATGTAYVMNLAGSIIDAVTITENVTKIRMPNTKGIYVISVNNNGKTEGINVIVE